MRKTLLFLSLLLLAASAASAVGCARLKPRTSLSQLAESREFVTQGQNQARRGDWENAESLYRDAVEACPQDERAHSHLADALWKQGRATDALAAQRKAVELNPTEVRYRLGLGEMQLSLGDPNAALIEANAALRIDRFSTAAWNLKGNALVALGRNQDGLTMFQRSLALDDSQTWVYQRIAELYELDQRPQRALATLQALEERYDGDDVPAPVLYHQALALQALHRREEAIEKLVLARRYDPDSLEVLATLAQLQWESGDQGNAQLTLNHLQNRWPDHPQVAAITERFRQPSETSRVLR